MTESDRPYEKAIEETAKATGKAIDVVNSMSPAIANAYGFLIGDRLAAARERNLDAITRKTRKILDDRNKTDPTPVPEQIGIPLLEEAQGETREELQGLYAALLANAMDKKYAGDVRPEYIDIVKRMQPIDVMLLRYAWERYESSQKVFGIGEATSRFAQYRATAVQLSLESLTALGCIRKHSQGEVLSNIGYEIMVACDPHATKTE